MNYFQFKEKEKKVENLCKKTIELLSLCEEPEIKNIISDFEQFLCEYQKQTKLTIAFIGQYNSGKSTIIAALTNARFIKKYYEEINDEKKLIEVYEIDSKELKIGAQITTDKTEIYEWGSVLLIDTPGIYAGRPEHDKITLDQISKSDLLVFVISNELFNPQAGEFFKKVSQEMQRVGQMVLVVNKMSRETGTPQDLLNTILKVIEPYHPDDFYTCFIDARSYLEACKEDDKDEKQFLMNLSNFGAFLEALNKLIKKNQLYARLVTPLHRAFDMIEKSLDILTTEDSTVRNFLEILRRKALILRASQTRLRNSFLSELDKLEYEVIMLGEEIASMIDGYHKEEEINSAIKKVQREIQLLREETGDKIQSLIKNEFERCQTEVEELIQSPLGRALREEIEITGVSKIAVKEITIEEDKKISTIFKITPEMFEQLGKFASRISRDTVYKTWKFFGGKFKPWGAVKATRFINKLGPILSGIGVLVDIFLTIKEEREKEKYEQQLREKRAEVRKNFRNIASEIRRDFENGWKDVENIYQQELIIIEDQRSKFEKNKKSKEEVVEKLKKLRKNIKNEISLLTK